MQQTISYGISNYFQHPLKLTRTCYILYITKLVFIQNMLHLVHYKAGVYPEHVTSCTLQSWCLSRTCYILYITKLVFIQHFPGQSSILTLFMDLLRFLRKKHSCGFILSKLCYTPIFLIHIFSIK